MISRREFFTRTKIENLIRPPWSNINTFNESCTQCNQCIESCPQKIIYLAKDNYPAVSFKNAGCDFCAKCADVCKEGAIDKIKNATWKHQLYITENCLAKKGITCRSCVDFCEADAFIIKLKLKGRINISIDTDQCTGCGECISACPENTIVIKQNLEV